jgi:eukaryotic-like serine/threonine-protein kinase
MQTILKRKEETLPPGNQIGRYRLIKHLKQGGMSTVSLAYHILTRAVVAIKVIDSNSVDLNMLHREIEITQALEHEHIVPCLDAGQYGRYHYLCMPYLRGGTLEDKLNEGLPTVEEARIVLEQLTSALEYIHSLGILHRDIKPANILFDQHNNLYLTDFGIVSWLGEKPGYDGHMLGTPHFVAPEIFEGYVDVRSEVYSVGILLYQMLTGYLPFDGASDKQICQQQRETPPLAPSIFNPSLPRPIERVILLALEKDPLHRYQTVEDLLHAFQMALEAPSFFQYYSSQWQKSNPKSQLAVSVSHIAKQ